MGCFFHLMTRYLNTGFYLDSEDALTAESFYDASATKPQIIFCR